MFLKFMPYMLATRVGGTPTTETIVSTLMMLFCSMLIRPKRRVEQQLHLVGQMRVVIVERSDVVAQGFEARGLLGRAANRRQWSRHIGHDAADPQQAVADLRCEIAAAPDPTQDDAQIGLLAGRAAIAAGLDGAGRGTADVTRASSSAGDAFEHVGEAIDDRFQQPGECVMRVRGWRVWAAVVNAVSCFEPHRDEMLPGQDEADRRRLRIARRRRDGPSGALRYSAPLTDPQPAGTLDFATTLRNSAIRSPVARSTNATSSGLGFSRSIQTRSGGSALPPDRRERGKSHRCANAIAAWPDCNGSSGSKPSHYKPAIARCQSPPSAAMNSTMRSTPSPVFRLVKTKGRSPRIRLRVALHHLEAGADQRREVDLVDDEQVGAGDAGPALARDLVAGGDVDDVDRQVGELGREGRREIVAARFDQHEIEPRETAGSSRRPRRG